jgi:hypothetical protein
MILGTFSGADYPLNAAPVHDMQELTRRTEPDGQNEIKLCGRPDDDQSDIGYKEPPFYLDRLNEKKKQRMVDPDMSRMNTLLSVIIDLQDKKRSIKR